MDFTASQFRYELELMLLIESKNDSYLWHRIFLLREWLQLIETELNHRELSVLGRV